MRAETENPREVLQQTMPGATDVAVERYCNGYLTK